MMDSGFSFPLLSGIEKIAFLEDHVVADMVWAELLWRLPEICGKVLDRTDVCLAVFGVATLEFFPHQLTKMDHKGRPSEPIPQTQLPPVPNTLQHWVDAASWPNWPRRQSAWVC